LGTVWYASDMGNTLCSVMYSPIRARLVGANGYGIAHCEVNSCKLMAICKYGSYAKNQKKESS
jgi:hypothetical protein